MDALDCVLLPRLVISLSGLDPLRMAQQAGIPGWALRTDYATISSGCYLRVWELAEHGVGVPDLAADIAQRYVVGALGLYDYLFITAPTLWEGFAATGAYMPTVSTNFRFEPAGETEEEITFAVHLHNGEGRGAELAMQFGLVGVFTRARRVTGQPVSPVRVAFRQRAPRRADALYDVFRTSAVDFGAPADTVTLRKADMALPLLGADPVLAAILRRYAETLPDPPTITTWLDRFRQAVLDCLEPGPSLTAVAARLATSPRTLQRRLAELGTTWRRELDRVRQAAYEGGHPAGLAAHARRLGYSDARSLSRAIQRWNA
ncbi:MAG: AraC family transcriptional regulator [Nonomuraea sp.]|nr:AraC family transcriptional regulator [Nonomuraea sp.]